MELIDIIFFLILCTIYLKTLYKGRKLVLIKMGKYVKEFWANMPRLTAQPGAFLGG